MTPCPSTDHVTGLQCVQPEGHPGLCSAPILNDADGQLRYWGTLTIPGDILDQWQSEAAEANGGI